VSEIEGETAIQFQHTFRILRLKIRVAFACPLGSEDEAADP
jgi:hypothetical protein